MHSSLKTLTTGFEFERYKPLSYGSSLEEEEFLVSLESCSDRQEWFVECVCEYS